ncbi:NBS-LRR type resistance protein [Cucumis melo var. makuwa]|uniref:NBS-LRR type resistance protein n=1 Tax=Cucumis melo var. makuwa TaxID=1194695 RepID=A0A5A7TIG3_CUCMM|nr:NBS-LRR type resistance protein [Cucumis melo var. makuwa]
MSSLNNEVTHSGPCGVVQRNTCLGVASSFHRRIRCWNSSPNLSQKVLNNYQGMRYARLFWVDDRATQKVFVEAPSLSHGRVVAIHQVYQLKKCTIRDGAISD